MYNEQVYFVRSVQKKCQSYKLEYWMGDNCNKTNNYLCNFATFTEKFAVANFLLQVGALQFRVQKSATNEDELQTVSKYASDAQCMI